MITFKRVVCSIDTQFGLGVVLSMITFKQLVLNQSLVTSLGVVLSMITFKQGNLRLYDYYEFGSSVIYDYFQTKGEPLI